MEGEDAMWACAGLIHGRGTDRSICVPQKKLHCHSVSASSSANAILCKAREMMFLGSSKQLVCTLKADESWWQFDLAMGTITRHSVVVARFFGTESNMQFLKNGSAESHQIQGLLVWVYCMERKIPQKNLSILQFHSSHLLQILETGDVLSWI